MGIYRGRSEILMGGWRIWKWIDEPVGRELERRRLANVWTSWQMTGAAIG